MGKTKIKTVEETEIKIPVKEEVVVEEKESKKTSSKKTSKPSKEKTRSKKYAQAKESVETNKKYTITEAIKLAQDSSYSKFTGSIEAHINTNSKNLRGLVTLPHLSGKQLRILAFGKDADQSGADIIGTEETLNEIDKGNINFDVLVTTPEWMPKLAKAARKLGPRGLMPSPKNGTITENLAKAVSELNTGKTEYRTEANGKVVHLVVGKVDQPIEEISANIKALCTTIGKSRVKKVTLAPSMGPGVKVELGSI